MYNVTSITLRQLLEQPLDIPLLQWAIFLIILVTVGTFIYLHTKQDSLDLRWLILDAHGRPYLPRIGQVAALIISSWGFVVLVLNGTLTETYFIGYMTVWSGNAALESYFSKSTRAPRRRDDSEDYRAGRATDDAPRGNPYDEERR